MTTPAEIAERFEGMLSELSDTDTECRHLQAEKDERIKAITDEYAPLIDPLTQRRAELMEQVAEHFVQHEDVLLSAESKSVVLRSGTISSRTSPGVLQVEDEAVAIESLRRLHKLRAFTREGKRTLNKVELKKYPNLIIKIPGIYMEVPEHLSVVLARTNIELKEELHPYRRRIR